MSGFTELGMSCCQVCYWQPSQSPDQALPSIDTRLKEEFQPSEQSSSHQGPSMPDLGPTSQSWQIFRDDSTHAASSLLNTDSSEVNKWSDIAQSPLNESEDSEINDDLPSLLEKVSVKRKFVGSPDVFTTPPPTERRRIERQRQSTVEFYREHAKKLPSQYSFGKCHNWSFDEREAVCLLYIFCACTFEGIAKILCEYFGKSFRVGQVKAQWTHWRYVFRTRHVYNPRQAWMHKRDGFEVAATYAGVMLKLRHVELKEKKLSPKYTKVAEKVAGYDAWFLGQLVKRRDGYRVHSPDTQSLGTPQSLVSPRAGRSSFGDSSAILELLEAARSLQQSPKPGSESELLRERQQEQTLEVNTLRSDESNNFDELPSFGGLPLFTGRHNAPSLLYRVYHDNSNGRNSPTLFRAGLFNIPGKSLVPPPENQILLLDFVSWHVWYHSVSSPLISCTDSLIMAVHKARAAEEKGFNPHIAIIDATSALSSDGHGHGPGFHAGPLITEARKLGLLPGMRYKGWREWLIWGEIAERSILHDLPFNDLRSLTANDIGIADLLALDDIDPDKCISRIRKQLLGQEALLDASGAHALGRLAVLFGLDVKTAPAMIAQFVFDVLRGWVLRVVEGKSEMDRVAECFADGMKSAEAAGRSTVVVLVNNKEEEVLKAAFVSGVERALRELKQERRRSVRR